MAKSVKTLICIIASFAVLLPCVLFSGVYNVTEAAQSDFSRALGSIYQKYDKNIGALNPRDEFALSRVIVSGWNNKTYGAIDVAYDSESDFAVLQYSSPDKAKRAQNKMTADGLIAEADSISVMSSDGKCTLSPEYSVRLGVDSYLDKFEMECDDVVVAVIDTGVMYDHEALDGRMYSTGIDYSGDNMTDAYYDIQERGDHYAHGTFVCSVIADNTPDSVKILPVKAVTFDTEETPASAIISGINYAVREGAKVINISLAAYYSKNNFEIAVNNALSKGVCICSSAGNDAEYLENRYPGCIDGVITVSSLNADCNEPASYTNYGSVIDFCAPGVRVYGAYPQNGQSTYKTWSGTSFSSPYIAALCADINCAESDISKEDVYRVLCDFSLDLGAAGRDDYCGNGMPRIGNIRYSAAGKYEFTIPQGVLNVYSSEDYTEATQPWKSFARKIRKVNINRTMTSVGDYMFYNMQSASFVLPQSFRSVGDYAFYNCKKIRKANFSSDNDKVGYKAFGGIENFIVRGYLNTPAETYALTEKTKFVKLGCNHNYFYESFEPEGVNDGYTVYTCSVCGDSYTGPYIQPNILSQGVCGDNLTYTVYDTGKLTVSGSGQMYDYTDLRSPWYEYRNDIRILEIREGVSSVCAFAFYGCDSIVKLYVSASNASFSTDGVSLFNKNQTEILLTFARGAYAIPETVNSVSSPAFIASKNLALESNGSITVKDSVLYDSYGNILAALPSYRERTLVINNQITVNSYAFILCEYPERLESNIISVNAGDYSLGYIYDGAITKHDFTVYACAENGASVYAASNGFTLEGGLYKCGNELTYSYDTSTQTLTIDGTGDMTVYENASDIPWYSRISSMQSLVIGDGVSSVSPNSFNGASSLTNLTMPLSVKAPEDISTWNGCSGIKVLNLTLGSGYMDDYENGNGDTYYSYTPWFISKTSIVSLTVDSNVKYVGKQAFRACTALHELTLNCVEKVGEDAFIACPKLRDFTVLSKNAILPDYCMLSYRAGTKKIYQGFNLKGYCDSTVKDYCTRLGAGFISLGCGHSRNVTLVDSQNDGLNVTERFICSDCNEEFTVVTDISSSVTGNVTTTDGIPVPNAMITVGNVSTQTDNNGEFTVSGLFSGNSSVSVAVNGVPLYSAEIQINEGVNSVAVTLRYADYVTDGVINAKDYAYSLRHGFDDAELFDYGRIQEGDNSLTVLQNEN